MDLTAEDLIGFGVASIGHRRKLLAAIAARRAGSISATTPATAAAAAVSGKVSLAPGAERRQLTVMFVDLVASTALAGARNAGNPHVACDVEGAGDVV
jgi:class 3 adenylate cyclase